MNIGDLEEFWADHEENTSVVVALPNGKYISVKYAEIIGLKTAKGRPTVVLYTERKNDENLR